MTLKEILAKRKAQSSGKPECADGKAVIENEDGQLMEVDLTMPTYGELLWEL